MDEVSRRALAAERRAKAAAVAAHVRACREEPRLSIVVDCSFSECMTTKESHSLARQISFTHSFTRGCVGSPPVGLTVCSVSPMFRDTCERYGAAGWFARLEESHFTSITKECVFLSPDADIPLEAVKEGVTYVIGGLVDRQVDKHQSLCAANKADVPARRLPLKEHIEGVASILNVNTVFEVLATQYATGSWSEALNRVPRRKCAPDGRQAQRRREGKAKREAFAQRSQAYRERQAREAGRVSCRLDELAADVGALLCLS